MRSGGLTLALAARSIWLVKMRLLVSVPVLLTCMFPVTSAKGQTYKETIVYNFDSKADDGVDPSSTLVLDAAGNIFGTTQSGGSHNAGTVFMIDAEGNETILHNFSGGTDGDRPEAGVVLAGEKIYGSTSGGGTFNLGTIFEISGANQERVLHSFKGGADGSGPLGALARDAAGNLYGTTRLGGKSDNGTVFKVSVNGTETILHSFTRGIDGNQPLGLVRDANGNLYGSTSAGGSFGWGCVFRVSTSGMEAVLYSFTTFLSPSGVIRDPAGNFYGTTALGGASDDGTVFKIDSAGHLTVLHTFSDGDGEYPSGVIRDTAGNLYGTTYGGGASEWGTVFKIDTTGTETILYSFAAGNDGAAPEAPVILDSEGNLYGTTIYGGDQGAGILFKLEIK